MPTKKPQILLTLPEELFKKIEDYRFDNRIGSRSEAVRQLIEKGLKDKIKRKSN
jgi:metal-responsive CopG/Arc/MetJ family transcriptional regulator